MAEGIQESFVKAWEACQNPELDSKNPHFGNMYASLKATLGVIRDACRPLGIAYRQRFAITENGGVLTSSVVSGTEEFQLSTFPVEVPTNPQAFGSNLTYAKRQQAQCDWCITGEPDDDGEAAASYGQARKAKPKAQQKPKEPTRREKMLRRCAELATRCIENGMDQGWDTGLLKAKYGVDRMDQLTDDQLVEFGTLLREMERQSSEYAKEGEQ